MVLMVILTVLSVILTILKVIGIILAVLVGLILLIVLLVGFVPIRYKAAGLYPAEGGMNEDVISRRKRDALMNKVKAADEKDEDEYGEHKKEIPVKVNAVVSWLLHIVHVTASYDSTGLVMTARLFGLFKIYSNDPETVKKKEEKRRKKEEKQKFKEEKKAAKEGKTDSETAMQAEGEDEAEIKSSTQTENEKSSGESAEKKETPDKEQENKSESANKDESAYEVESEKAENSSEKDESDSFEDFDIEDEEELENYKGISGKFRKIGDKIKGIKEKINSLRKKKDYLLAMKDNPRVQNGISYAKKKLFLIVKRVLPKKLEGRIAFGMDDPSTTGKILAGASVFYPVWGGHFDVEPDFEQKRLEIDASLKGRIFLAMLAIPALKIWFNKDVKYIRRKIKGFKKL